MGTEIEVTIEQLRVVDSLRSEFEFYEHVDRTQAVFFEAKSEIKNRPFGSVFDCTDFLAEAKRIEEIKKLRVNAENQ